MFYPTVLAIKLKNIEHYYCLGSVELKRFNDAVKLITTLKTAVEVVDYMPLEGFDNFIFESS